MSHLTLARDQLLGPIASRIFKGKNPWTDGFPAYPALQSEIDLLLEFVVSQKQQARYFPRLERGKPAQRYECLNELRLAFYLTEIGFEITEWEPLGNNGSRGEFSISVGKTDAIFVEVKSPGWEGTLSAEETNRGRAKQPKYLESEGAHRIKPNWEDVRKNIDRAYHKFSPDWANLLAIADDFFMPLDNRQMQIALREPPDGQYGPGYFTSRRFANLGGVMVFANETMRLEFSEDVQAAPRYGHLFYANPYAFNRTLERWIHPEEKPSLRRVRRGMRLEGGMMSEVSPSRVKPEPPNPIPRMTTAITLGPNSHAGCPVCGRRIALLVGVKDAFMSEERRLVADSAVQLDCPTHGKFEALAADFITDVPQRV
jgi:hypothetical protein